MITEQMLRERMAALAAARDRALAEANAWDGAYRECERWLKELARQSEAPIEPSPE
jgi:hypothetical protein